MPQIRNLAVGLPVRDGHVLVSEGTDSVKGSTFHRALGGGIEFGETAEGALRREFVEELGVVLGAVELLGVLENIFEYEGAPGHEIVHVFAVRSADIDVFSLDEQLQILDEGSVVRWVEVDTAVHSIYPTGVDPMIRRLLSRG